jgi:hypothetical protein
MGWKSRDTPETTGAREQGLFTIDFFDIIIANVSAKPKIIVNLTCSHISGQDI